MLKPEDNILEYMDDYVHGLLSPEDARRVESFCQTSRLGQVALEEAQRRHQALQSLPPSEASTELIHRTIRNIDMTDQRRTTGVRIFRRTLALATAAAVLMIGSLHVYYQRLQPSPYDLRLLGQQQLLAGSPAALRVAVLDQRTGRPVGGVPVRIALCRPGDSGEVELANLTTDQRGGSTPRFELPDWEDGRYELRVTARPAGGTEVTTQWIELKRDWRLMVSTDKPVYQPGQTIHVRSLALKKPDLKPVAGQPTTFTVTDPKGNVIFKQQDVTSRFGISACDCALASEILEGEYRVQCSVGATTSDATVTVEKYVLPKFKLAITVDRSFYGPGEEVRGSIQADYFFGKPVAGGEVKLEAQTLDIGPSVIATLDRRTDDAGRAEFSFRLPQTLVGREQDGGQARFLLGATVIDTAGQKYATGITRIVTADPIRVEVIPESGTLVQGLSNKVYLITSYADGQPARTRLVVHGHEQELETSAAGVASVEIAPQTPQVGLTVKATDREGRVGRKHITLTCGQFDGDFLLRPDKAVYTGGQTMRLEALGGGVEPVFVDLLKDQQTILTQQIEMQDGRGRLDFDLPPELSGTIELVAYRFRAAGLAVRKSRVVYVRQAEQLSVRATLDQAEYRPGTKAAIQLTLSDPDGKPVPGAISLQAVDEAVYAVLRQQSGLEQTFFLLEQELLQPVYAIYPGWSPLLFSELPIGPRNELEQALFSRTVTQVDGPGALPPDFFTGPPGAGNGLEARLVEPMPDEVVMFEGPMPGGPLGELAAPPAVRSPFTLAAASFPRKQQQVAADRAVGLQRIRVAWGGLAAALLLTGAISFAVFRPRAFLITALVSLCLFCVIGVPVAGLGLLMLMGGKAAMPAATAEAVRGEAMFAPMAEMAMDFAGAAAPMGGAEPMTSPTQAPADDTSSAAPQPAAPPRVRQWFPETLLWRPELITDDQGRATLELDLADSITTWRLSTSAVSAAGKLGGGEFPLRVFQPFFVDLNLPVALTRNDEVGVPVVVYNYLDKPQTVTLELAPADWFARLPEAKDESSPETSAEASEPAPPSQLKLELAAGEIRSLSFPIKVLRVGRFSFEVTATGSGVADAIRREIEVVPDGQRVEQVASGALSQPFSISLEVPDNAIEGSVRAIVKIYPSRFSEVVEGLDAIFQMPSGCFEQTSSTTYPNVLALDYLRRTGKSVPEVEAKARQYIHLGYQRLVAFEVAGGGFDWFGNPPANRTLTAYGLMEFQDMARVHDVDPQLLERTRRWLLAQRRQDGSWPSEAGMLDDGLAGSVYRGGQLDLAATAYVALAVFAGGQTSTEAAATLDFLLAHPPASINDPYILALTASAIAAIERNHAGLSAYLARLDEMKNTSPDGKRAWWTQVSGGRTAFYGSGQAGDIETTAMATLALLRGQQSSGTVRAALNWLIEQKDPRGTWHSTQATVLALKALLEGTGAAAADEQERRVELTLGGEKIRELVIPADQAEVLQQIDLSSMFVPGNRYELALADRSETAVGYQVAFRYHLPQEPQTEAREEPLAINIAYDRQRLSVDETVTAAATIVNRMDQPAPMVILDLPIPGGFAIDPGELDELVGSQLIARYQITARKAIVYLRRLDPGQSLELRYRLRATMPVKVAVPDAEAYEYYNPARRGRGGRTQLEAT